MSVYQNSYSNIFILFNESKFLGQVLMSQRTNKNTPKIRKGSIKGLFSSIISKYFAKIIGTRR